MCMDRVFYYGKNADFVVLVWNLWVLCSKVVGRQ